MKILMGNNTLSLLAGSEMWILTLAKELKRLGHSVTCYSTDLGLIATKLEADGIHCVKEVGESGSIKPFNPFFEEDQNGDFDVIICNHYEITKYLHSQFPTIPIIATVHGIIHKGENGEIYPEHPITEFKVDQYVAVSEEVQDLLSKEYNIDSVIIRNFFDLQKFNSDKKIKEKPEMILVNSNYWGVQDDINKTIKEVADHYGAKFIGIGANFAPTYEVEEVMKDVDIVFGMGRSVLEGVCMRCLGVVHGRWGTGGILAPDTVNDIRATNFSGRNSGGNLLSSQALIAEIDKYFNQKNIDAMHSYMKKRHNVEVAAKQFIKIAEGLIKK